MRTGGRQYLDALAEAYDYATVGRVEEFVKEKGWALFIEFLDQKYKMALINYIASDFSRDGGPLKDVPTS